MERLTRVINGVVTYVGVENQYDTGLTAAEMPTNAARAVLAKLATYEDTGLEPEEITVNADNRCVFYCNRRCNLDGDWCVEGPGCPMEVGPDKRDYLRELVQADQNGRLVVLPCKVGDIVYQVRRMTHAEALRAGVPEWGKRRKYSHGTAIYCPLTVKQKKMVKSDYPQFGKTIFLTREEAEAALEENKNGNQR